MNIRSERQGSNVKVYIDGSCTIYTVKELYAQMVSFYQKFQTMVIDASKIDEMDSSAFQLFLALKKDSVKSGRKVSIVNHSPAFLRFLDLFGAAGLFHDRLTIPRKDKKLYPFKYGTKISRFE